VYLITCHFIGILRPTESSCILGENSKQRPFLPFLPQTSSLSSGSLDPLNPRFLDLTTDDFSLLCSKSLLRLGLVRKMFLIELAFSQDFFSSNCKYDAVKSWSSYLEYKYLKKLTLYDSVLSFDDYWQPYLQFFPIFTIFWHWKLGLHITSRVHLFIEVSEILKWLSSKSGCMEISATDFDT